MMPHSYSFFLPSSCSAQNPATTNSHDPSTAEPPYPRGHDLQDARDPHNDGRATGLSSDPKGKPFETNAPGLEARLKDDTSNKPALTPPHPVIASDDIKK